MTSIDRNVLQLYFRDGAITVFPNDDMKSIQNIECDYTTVNENLIDKVLKKAINLFPKLKFKAITFHLQDNPLGSQKFRKKCKEFCEENGYFCYFVSFFELTFHIALYHSKIILPENEKVIICSINDTDLLYRVYIRCKEFYQLEYVNRIKDIDLKNLDFLKLSFMSAIGRFDSKKIVLINATPQFYPKYTNEKKIASILQTSLSHDYEMIMCDKSLAEYGFDAPYAYVLDEMDHKKHPYFLKPVLEFDFILSHGNITLYHEKDWIPLPLEKIFTLKVKSKNERIMLKLYDGKLIETIKLDEYIGQEIEVTFKVDNDRFYSLFVETAETKKLAEALSKTLKVYSEYKAKIVLNETDCSIAVTKTEKSWKNIQKFPLFISFTEAKPIVGEEAKKISIQKPSFVVSDFLKLCALENLENVDPKWPFSIVNDTNNEIMVEFDTHEGRKASPLSFLMALVFRDCLSRIKKETGVKPTELQIKINFEGNKDLIKANLVKAGERLKIKITFI